MPHVTFLHGIANKPAPEVLLRIWRNSLAQDNGIDLGAEGITSRMVYWADVMYDHHQPEQAEHESNESIIAKRDTAIDMTWSDGFSESEKLWVEQVAGKLRFDMAPPDGDEEFVPSEPPSEDTPPTFERIPLPWWLKRQLMKTLLRDVHHYLFNSQHSPRPGVSYRVQDEIRARTIDAISEGAKQPGPHIVVSHSMGTVIAYDCLKRVPDCAPVDGLMTVGSPLGLDEVQDKLQPGWSRHDGFPQKANGNWVNVYDRLDPVAGFDANITNDYKLDGTATVRDINEQNYGKWRHNISKYLEGVELRAALEELLEL